MVQLLLATVMQESCWSMRSPNDARRNKIEWEHVTLQGRVKVRVKKQTEWRQQKKNHLINWRAKPDLAVNLTGKFLGGKDSWKLVENDAETKVPVKGREC